MSTCSKHYGGFIPWTNIALAIYWKNFSGGYFPFCYSDIFMSLMQRKCESVIPNHKFDICFTTSESMSLLVEYPKW